MSKSYFKSFFIDDSWLDLFNIFRHELHGKTGESNSKYTTYFAQDSVNTHDCYLKLAPEVTTETDNVFLKVQYTKSETTEKPVVKIMVYPLHDNKLPSHRIVIRELEDGVGINAEPLCDETETINGRYHVYAHIAKITTS